MQRLLRWNAVECTRHYFLDGSLQAFVISLVKGESSTGGMAKEYCISDKEKYCHNWRSLMMGMPRCTGILLIGTVLLSAEAR